MAKTYSSQNGPLFLCLKGAQGSGKDKQAELLEKTLRGKGYQPKTLQMSSLLEAAAEAGVRNLMDQGKPVPCAMLRPLFEEAMDQAVGEGHDAIIANGYPRYTDQQVDDFAALAWKHGCQTIIVRILATPELCKKRILRRAEEMLAAGKNPRADDLDPVAVENRLARYFQTRAYVSRRLLTHHRFPHVTVTASDDLTKEDLHERIVRQLWPREEKSPPWALPGTPVSA
jgi:adenylate kinase family enzyme